MPSLSDLARRVVSGALAPAAPPAAVARLALPAAGLPAPAPPTVPYTVVSVDAAGRGLDTSTPMQARFLRRLDAVADDLRSAGGSSDPILRLIRRLPGSGAEHAGKMLVNRALRETLPVLNTAIAKRRFVEGVPVIESRDAGLQTALRDFAERLPLQNYEDPMMLTGLDVALDAMSNNADTVGMSFGEKVIRNGVFERYIIPAAHGFYFRDIERREVETIDGREVANTRRYWQLRQSTTDGDREVRTANVDLFMLQPPDEGPWGLSLAWGMPFVAEILVRMLMSMNNLWWKSGDPSTFWQIIYERGPDGQLPDGADLQADIDDLTDVVTQTYVDRASGQVTDAFWAGAGAKVETQAIGENVIINSLAPYLRDHYTIAASQIIGRSDLPVWMFPAGTTPADGLGGDRSSNEARAAERAAALRNVRRRRLARSILDTFLLLDRRGGGLSRYDVRFEAPPLVDPKEAAEARKAAAEASAAEIDNALLLRDSELFAPGDDAGAYLRRARVLPPVDDVSPVNR